MSIQIQQKNYCNKKVRSLFNDLVNQMNKRHVKPLS